MSIKPICKENKSLVYFVQIWKTVKERRKNAKLYVFFLLAMKCESCVQNINRKFFWPFFWQHSGKILKRWPQHNISQFTSEVQQKVGHFTERKSSTIKSNLNAIQHEWGSNMHVPTKWKITLIALLPKYILQHH